MSKICRNCNLELDYVNFYKTKNKSYSDNMLNWCKSCIKEYRKMKRVPVPRPEFSIEKKEIIYSFD